MNTEWSIKQSLLAMFVFFAIFLSTASRASADVIITFSDGATFRCEGACDGWFPDPSAYPRCASAPATYKSTDSMIYNTATGQGWIVTGGIKTPILSDHWHTFLVNMKAKYPSASITPEIRQTIANEIAAFSKTTDDIAVSMARMKILSKETGIRIVSITPIVETPKVDTTTKTQH